MHDAYEKQISGLAIAVLAVVGFHAFPKFIKGGFIGVDVFFCDFWIFDFHNYFSKR